jgi:hypothetical protein
MPIAYQPTEPRRFSPGDARSVLSAFAAGALFITIAGPVPAMAQGAQSVPNQVPTAPDGTAPNAPLSEKLDRSKGVLQPPSGVDPEIHVPAPEPNPQTTPVIPPPGTPGGNQNVQPK